MYKKNKILVRVRILQRTYHMCIIPGTRIRIVRTVVYYIRVSYIRTRTIHVFFFFFQVEYRRLNCSGGSFKDLARSAII